MVSKSSYTRTIYHLCDNPNANYLQVNDIEHHLALDIPKISPKGLMMALQKHKHKILLIDYQSIHLLTEQVRDLPLTDKNFETIVFNVPKRLTTEQLLELGNLKGLFGYKEDNKAIAKGCAEIINGQNWLPRKVCAQLLHYYRHVIDQSRTPVVVDLTCREVQILQSLRTGASNLQIAEDLFISEFTVKSHLYQIFKKLSVRNRAQAISWAKQHILS
ncbi:LuxR C-terminal-related transcriptional regulator [Vibrio sp. AK197]|uniref:LuxR C-terminal-related transcriptional regulator n=1 Tax=Vibrio olivae TaxID=1243002 RepID=A0ABV5HSE8_9VIBR